jgi:3-hydroxyisobutyrate dehydrogenase
MARNLRANLPADDLLVVHDVNRDASKALVKSVPGEQGVRIAENMQEIAECAETVFTALPQPAHVKSVYTQMLETLAPHAVNGVQKKERLFIDCSTIDPMTSGEVAMAAQSSGKGRFVDAPMSGGVVGARAGTLTFMIGCDDELVPRATAALSLMGRRVLHLGAQGAGLKGKLANNYLLALNNIATAEAMNMGVSWGLDPHALAGMINTSTGRCWPSEVNNPVPGVVEGAPAGRGYEGGFGVGLANKDLKLAIKAAQEFGLKLGLGEAASRLYDAVEKDERCRGKDFSVVYRYLGGKE